MQKKKRNHFVPQSYLRSFAADAARTKIWTFGKERGDPALKSIRKVAVRFYLYAPNGPQGRDYSLEDKLSSLEQLFAGPTWTAIGTGFIDLSSEPLRKGLSLLTAVMFLRNPTWLDRVRSIHGSLVGLFSQFDELPDLVEIAGREYELDKNTWPDYRDASEDESRRMWLREIGGATYLAKIMMEMRWAILASETPVFITTDNPVTVVHKSLRFRGFKNPDSTVLFPLSPTRILCLDNRRTEPDGQYYPLRDNGASTNLLLWRNAIECVFCPRHPDKVCAEMLRDTEQREFA